MWRALQRCDAETPRALMEMQIARQRVEDCAVARRAPVTTRLGRRPGDPLDHGLPMSTSQRVVL